MPSGMARVLTLPQRYRPLRAHSPLVVVAEPVDGSALGTLIRNARHGDVPLRRGPGSRVRPSPPRQSRDIASLTAAQVITKDGEGSSKAPRMSAPVVLVR